LNKGISTAWTKTIKDPEKKQSFENLLRNSTLVNSRLLEILQEMYESEENSSVDYESASWSHKQADRNGARRAIRQIMTLFEYMESR